MRIDYADQKRVKQLPQSEPVFGGNELRYLSDVIQSGWISSKGKYVDLFEKNLLILQVANIVYLQVTVQQLCN